MTDMAVPAMIDTMQRSYLMPSRQHMSVAAE
jgi:hypothetical protein